MYLGDPYPRYTPGLQGQRCYRKEFFKQNMLYPVYNNKCLAKLKCIQLLNQKKYSGKEILMAKMAF
jgi:hypothetical protein